MRNIVFAAVAIAAVTVGHAYADGEQYRSGPFFPLHGSQRPEAEAPQVAHAPAAPGGSGLPVNSTGWAVAGLPSSAPAMDYRFEILGQPQQNGGIGKLHQVDSVSIVRIRLIRIPENTVVGDAEITRVTADMGPDGMPSHTARTRILSSDKGVYRIEVHPGMAGDWAVHLAAYVPRRGEKVRGTVTARLAK